MSATYTTRELKDFSEILNKLGEEDLLSRADLLAQSSDPDAVFFGRTLTHERPFGTLVLFASEADQKANFPFETNDCGHLEALQALIVRLNEYPEEDVAFFDSRRQAYLKEAEHYKSAKRTVSDAAKELHRLETAVKNAGLQKKWLEKENEGRTRKIENLSEEIRNYEAALKKSREQLYSHDDRINLLRSQSAPLKESIEVNTKHAQQLMDRETQLRNTLTLSNRILHPNITRANEAEAQTAGKERSSLMSKISEDTTKLSGIEAELNDLETRSGSHREETGKLEDSLTVSSSALKKAEDQLQNGTKMIAKIDNRVDGLAKRIAVLGQSDLSSIEERENSYIAMLARAEDLVHAWISSSKTLRTILDMDDVQPSQLIEALFFAYGTLSAAGDDACMYLDAAGTQLNNLLLYRHEEERAGFWHINVFQ